jgi:hypothetical protein
MRIRWLVLPILALCLFGVPAHVEARAKILEFSIVLTPKGPGKEKRYVLPLLSTVEGKASCCFSGAVLVRGKTTLYSHKTQVMGLSAPDGQCWIEIEFVETKVVKKGELVRVEHRLTRMVPVGKPTTVRLDAPGQDKPVFATITLREKS